MSDRETWLILAERLEQIRRAREELEQPEVKLVFDAAMSRVIETSLGRFRKVAGPETPFLDRWTFECPGCGQWAYLDDDQWYGRVSVDHSADGCMGGYHETHDYFAALEAACNDPDATVTP